MEVATFICSRNMVFCVKVLVSRTSIRQIASGYQNNMFSIIDHWVKNHHHQTIQTTEI